MKETKIEIPAGCEVEKIETVDGAVVVTFKEAKPKLSRSWEEFCEMFPNKENQYYIEANSEVTEMYPTACHRLPTEDKNLLPNRATAEAVLALCQLIQLRNCYNGDWVPEYEELRCVICFIDGKIDTYETTDCAEFLYFKSEELRDEFLRNFRDLIEKLKPLYGIKEGGEE